VRNASFPELEVEKSLNQIPIIKLSHYVRQIIKSLIENNAKVDATDKDGQTVLYYAAAFGHLKIIKLLIENDAKVMQQTMMAGQRCIVQQERGTWKLSSY
jgi:ankyrin repeat protein